MQKIIDFIIRKKDLLVFFVLFSISIGFIFNTNSLHKSKFILFSSDIANYTNENIKYFMNYLDLEKTNKRLIEENSYLKNQLEKTAKVYDLDSVVNPIFQYQTARVVSNNLSSLKNQLIINKGLKNGLENDMGVINSKGIIGIINKTSKNYSSVMSILNIDIKINAKTKRTGHFGTLQWDGFDIKHLLLNDISENADIRIGDSIITGGMSLIFPEGINIGVVSEIIKQDKFDDTNMKFNIDNQVKIANIKFRENYLNIEVKLHSDMDNLNNVYVIESLNKKEFKNINK
tara:strand:+ start:6957 stop:7820 length:864 start_codon:yes stop_codon:yes gene_type:complete